VAGRLVCSFRAALVFWLVSHRRGALTALSDFKFCICTCFGPVFCAKGACRGTARLPCGPQRGGGPRRGLDHRLVDAGLVDLGGPLRLGFGPPVEAGPRRVDVGPDRLQRSRRLLVGPPPRTGRSPRRWPGPPGPRPRAAPACRLRRPGSLCDLQLRPDGRVHVRRGLLLRLRLGAGT
jgi:hypothetical protein